MDKSFGPLIKLYKESPEKLLQVFLDNPDLRDQVIELNATFEAGERVSVEGFKIAYKKFYGRELPYVDIPVAEQFVWAFHNKKGVMYESWRGKGKSTFFAAWAPYVMGVRPVGSTSLVRVNDAKAKEMGKLIADLIETNPGWKEIFPHVIPDERAGWSVENGFNVLDTRVTGVPGSKRFEEKYAKWRMACLADHLSEKSLICAGIESGSIIGLHSTNGMWFDDLHDELNTRSQAEMKKVVDILQGNIVPTWFSAGGSPTLGVFCTPWSVNPPDGYQVMLKTNMFKHIKMPIFVADEEGVEVPGTYLNADGETLNVDSEWVGKKVRLTWPEMFPIAKVAEMIVAYKTRFGQMCLCDVSQSAPKNMRYQSFPASDIKWDQWPLTNGVDPVGTVAGVSSGDGISHFASAWLLKTPYNNLVLGGGIVEKCDAMAGEQHVLQTQRTYNKTYRTASIELNGVGALFVGMITRNKGVKWSGHEVKEIGPGSKKERQYRFLQPLFANGSILVSDDPNDVFLIGVREYLDNFPNFDKDSYLWDIGDAIAVGVLDIPEVWTRIVTGDTTETIWNSGQRRAFDPYAALLDGRR
jgi:hypothetical protein